MLRRNVFLLLLILGLLTATGRAEHPHGPATGPASAPAKDEKPGPEQDKADKLSVTEHQISVDGQPLKYRATAGTLLVRDEAGKGKANFFFVAYEKQPTAEPAAARPVTFVFNGGPGAASVWLQLGAAGPRRVKLDENGDPPSAPFELTDNGSTWLTATDLVFIDPVGTGYSRPAEGEKGEQFFGVQEDIHSVADFIRLYVTRYQRWLSPKFLAGESYGTTRAAGLSQYLIDESGISLNGIILISSVLDFATIEPGDGNDLPYALFLPSYTAIAHYHKKLPPDLQKADLGATIAQVETWALGDYTTALAAGAGLPPDRRHDVVQKLARYTGLSEQFVDKCDLRIGGEEFRKALLNDSRQVVGRFDGRIAGFDPDPVSARADYDPSFAPYFAVYSATFNDYVRRTLSFESDLPYYVLSGRVQPWNFGRSGAGYLDVSQNLSSAMIKSPRMRVMFANGLEDLATPFLTMKYTVSHMTLSPELRANISQKFYEGGHMMYHCGPSLTRLNADVTQFITSAADSAGK